MTNTLLSYRQKQFQLNNLNARQIRLFSVAVYCCYLMVSLFNIHRFTMDEKIYHYPNMINFYKNGLSAIFNDRYSAANTPLPYIIVALFAKLFGPSLVLARTLTTVVSLCTFFVIIKLFEASGVKPYYSLILLFYPYFFLNSFVFYVINFGLFFCLLAFLIVYRSEKKKSSSYDLALGITLSLAILSQQFYVAVAGVIVIFRLYDIAVNTAAGSRIKHILTTGSLLLLPLLVPAYIFFRWEGLVHPNFRIHTVSFNPTNMVGILFVTGLFFVPYLFQQGKKLNTAFYAFALIAAAVLVFFFTPKYNDINGPGVFNGITFHLLSILRSFSPVLFYLVISALTGSGILVLYKLIISQPSFSSTEKLLFFTAILLVITYAFNSIMGERHFLGFIFILYILLLPRFNPASILPYMACMVLLGMGYFFYWIFFKFN